MCPIPFLRGRSSVMVVSIIQKASEVAYILKGAGIDQ